MDDASPLPCTSRGHRRTPDRVWDAARRDYLAGFSGPEVCERHALKLSTFRRHAAKGEWRRADQPAPDLPDDPLDEGQALEAEVDGDLNRLEYSQLSHVANCRMMRAVLRGGAIEALRWSRVEALMAAKQDEVDQWVDEMETAAARARDDAADAELDAMEAALDAPDE